MDHSQSNMAFDYSSIYNKIQNPQVDNQEDSRENEELAAIYARLHGGATPKQDEPLGYETNVGQVYDKLDEGISAPSTRFGKLSLTDLANNDKFNEVSERFLESIGSNDNIFEYLRDSEYSLSSAIVRAKQANDWTAQQQQDYRYLTQQFQNADLKGFKEHFGLIKDLGIDEKELWWYTDLRKFGTAIHSGFGLGFERLVMFATGMSNIRDVIPFPRTPQNAEF